MRQTIARSPTRSGFPDSSPDPDFLSICSPEMVRILFKCPDLTKILIQWRDNEDEEEPEEEAQGWNHHQDRLTSGRQEVTFIFELRHNDVRSNVRRNIAYISRESIIFPWKCIQERYINEYIGFPKLTDCQTKIK